MKKNEKRLNIIDQISEIRAMNNKNWMSLLKLAFHVAPEEAKIIMNKIVECDEQIKELCKELTKI